MRAGALAGEVEADRRPDALGFAGRLQVQLHDQVAAGFEPPGEIVRAPAAAPVPASSRGSVRQDSRRSGGSALRSRAPDRPRRAAATPASDRRGCSRDARARLPGRNSKPRTYRVAVPGTATTKLRNTSVPSARSVYSGSVTTRSGSPSCHPALQRGRRRQVRRDRLRPAPSSPIDRSTRICCVGQAALAGEVAEPGSGFHGGM